jgi:alpha-L-fucosidase
MLFRFVEFTGNPAPRRWSLLLIVASLFIGGCSDLVEDSVLERSRQTPDWFDDGKLGIFIHWGPASVPAYAAGGSLQPGELEEILLHEDSRQVLPYVEWYMYALGVPGSETARHHANNYQGMPYKNFARTFEQRVDEQWNPDVWAETFAKAGATYVVLVTKHHDGYTLWPSAVENPHQSEWNSRRDMVGELAKAVRKRGMRFGTYYSTGLDWSFQLVTEGDLVGDMMRSAPGSQEYADYAYAHVEELVDRYQPDVMWADIGYPSKGRLSELLQMYFDRVPDGVVNDRWGAVDKLGDIAELPGAVSAMKFLGRIMTDWSGDELKDDPSRIGFKTAEYDSLGGIAPFKWEATRGLGSSFAFNAAETAEETLSAPELVEFLVDTVAKNGNVLINVGPDSYGQISAIQQAPLHGLGEWLEINGEAIYGTSPWKRYQNERGRSLRYTQTDDALYATVLGEVGLSFSIEKPDIGWQGLDVLGAEVLSVDDDGDMLTLTLEEPLDGAAVVKFIR